MGVVCRSIQLIAASLLVVTVVGGPGSHGQTAAPDIVAVPPLPPKRPEQQDLRALVAPIAFYPDDLLALILPASTFPAEIVQAGRLLYERQADPTLEPEPSWDPSVIALLNYPEVIAQMNDDLAGTVELGDAVLADPQSVFDAIQILRNEALDAGYLETTETTMVVDQGDTIVVQPADPEVITVPSYDPAPVIVNQYATAPPVIYGPPVPAYWNPGATFFTGLFFGTAIGFALDWDDDDIDIDIDRGDVNIDRGDINIDSARIERINNSFGARRDLGSLQGRAGDDGRVSWRAERSRPQLSSAQRETLDRQVHGLAPARVPGRPPGHVNLAGTGRIGDARPDRNAQIGRPAGHRETVRQSERGRQSATTARRGSDAGAWRPQRDRPADMSARPLGRPEAGRSVQRYSDRGSRSAVSRGRR